MALTIWVILLLSQVLGLSLGKCPGQYLQNPALTRFRKYLQMDTSKPQNLPKAVEFWRQQCEELELPFQVIYPKGQPVVIIKVLGSEPWLPSIMLNSHMDVVPAKEDDWTYPPYAAYIDEKGDIYGRGTQDAKDVTCQCMEVVRLLKKKNVVLRRTLYITIMPDEETGGFNGMKPFVETKEFCDMNVGFILDEGIPSPDGKLQASYQDKRPWQMIVTVYNDDGHGSGMANNTAVDKARRLMNIVYAYRELCQADMIAAGPRNFGAFTNLNINILLTGSTTINVLPIETTVGIEMRLAVDSNVADMERLVQSWIDKIGPGTKLHFMRKDVISKKTVLNKHNPYWVAIKNAVADLNMEIIPMVYPATSDSLVLRNLGIPAVGFAPKLNTPNLVHAKDERLNAITFLNGINIYCGILTNLGNLPSTDFY